MATPPTRTDELQHASFLIVLVIVSLLMAVIAYPFAQPLLWATLAAIMFQPLYRHMLRQVRGRRNTAAGLSLLAIFLVIMLPAAWIGAMVVEQALVLVETLQKQPPDLAALFDQSTPACRGSRARRSTARAGLTSQGCRPASRNSSPKAPG